MVGQWDLATVCFKEATEGLPFWPFFSLISALDARVLLYAELS